MLKVLSVLMTFFIGKVLGASQSPSTLIKIPLLMIRRVVQLSLIGLGSLVVGLIAVGFLLAEVTSQLRLQNEVILTSSIGTCLVLALAGVIGCAVVFRKKHWVEAENLTAPKEPQSSTREPDLMQALSMLIMDYVQEKSLRRQSTGASDGPAAPMTRGHYRDRYQESDSQSQH